VLLSFLARPDIADGRISTLSQRRIDTLHDDIVNLEPFVKRDFAQGLMDRRREV